MDMCTSTASHLTTDPSTDSLLTDDGIDLFIWGNAESAVTIIAASIPILRVLVREVRSTARRYYVSKEGGTGSSGLRSRTGRNTQHNTVVISGGNLTSSRHHSHVPSKVQDDSSDKSILSDGPYSKNANGRIVRTNEINVAYQSRKDADSDYEMQPV